MVVQVVKVSIKPDMRDRWLELMKLNAVNTRAEEGCMSYQVGEDIETPGSFVIVEEWSTIEAQYGHFRNPKFAELMGSLSEVLAGPPQVSIHSVESTVSLDEALRNAR